MNAAITEDGPQGPSSIHSLPSAPRLASIGKTAMLWFPPVPRSIAALAIVIVSRHFVEGCQLKKSLNSVVSSPFLVEPCRFQFKCLPSNPHRRLSAVQPRHRRP